MKNAIFSSLLVMSLATTGIAHAEHPAGKPNPPVHASALRWADGEVVKINEKQGKVTLRHGDIPDVMPAMTMTYRVLDAQVLQLLHKGDKVRFVMEKRQDDYLVTQIEPVR